MIDNAQIDFDIGLAEHEFPVAARLYDQAFGPKFAVAIRSRQARRAILQQAFVGDFALTARHGDKLVGLAGFHTPDGALTGGITAGRLLSALGVVRGLRAALVFGLYEREPADGELLMDGIAVDPDYRGRGIGGRLLRNIVDHARTHGFATVRLDVIDTNPDAQRLYERFGFSAVRTQAFPGLRWLLGFGAATTMAFDVAGDDAGQAR